MIFFSALKSKGTADESKTTATGKQNLALQIRGAYEQQGPQSGHAIGCVRLCFDKSGMRRTGVVEECRNKECRVCLDQRLPMAAGTALNQQGLLNQQRLR